MQQRQIERIIEINSPRATVDVLAQLVTEGFIRIEIRPVAAVRPKGISHEPEKVPVGEVTILGCLRAFEQAQPVALPTDKEGLRTETLPQAAMLEPASWDFPTVEVGRQELRVVVSCVPEPVQKLAILE